MNFEEAIAAHTKWKIRLRSLLDGGGEKLDGAKVSKDNECDLGKWIYGEGATYKSLTAYAKLQAAHAQFHKCAGQIVSHANGGKKADAEALLKPDGEFAKRSSETVTAIMQMRKEAGM